MKNRAKKISMKQATRTRRHLELTIWPRLKQASLILSGAVGCAAFIGLAWCWLALLWMVM